MCDRCDDTAMDQILDFVLIGAGLEVAIALTRDRFVQYSLSSDGGINEVRHISDRITEKGNALRGMNFDDYADTVLARYATVAMT